ncbi:unnamed protein product [Diplocarpon coronariae]|uniref:CID domain-containing protein n=1 Tax=Diplocarpon coronariae TaxID=2795749 RepID=A0A218Z2U3_9HELO|nr:CTD kinase subunit gamma [Diplocarpon mali]OWP01950.1 hypothetical protein B2J93_4576 [Marssonina coronariae]
MSDRHRHEDPGSKFKRKPVLKTRILSSFERYENDDKDLPIIPIPNDCNHLQIPERSCFPASKASEGMDPFEVRVRFTSFLSSMTASVTSSNKAAQYALKFRDLDEDLHSCILEQLERNGNSMNNRANIMYFIEHLCDMAARENHYDYIRMMQRDILRIVDAVAPEHGAGAANVKVVRRVLQALQTKSFLLEQTVSEIEELLRERDTLPDTDVDMDLDSNATSRGKSNAAPKLEKKQVEQRIEEDRERHKRLRENIWAIPKMGSAGVTEDEFDKLWDETSDLGEDDFELYAEEAAERAKCAAEWRDEFTKKSTGTEGNGPGHGQL